MLRYVWIVLGGVLLAFPVLPLMLLFTGGKGGPVVTLALIQGTETPPAPPSCARCAPNCGIAHGIPQLISRSCTMSSIRFKRVALFTFDHGLLRISG
jgi:hypothetical protein